MNRKTALTVTLIVVVAALIVCLVPWPIPYRQTLNAVKIDASGKELGAVQIPFEGTKYTSLILGSTLDVTFGPIEDFHGTAVKTSTFRSSPFHPYLTLSKGITNTTFEGDLTDAIKNDGLTSTSYTCHLRISPDLDRWYIHIVTNNEQECYYVGAFRGSFSTAQLYEYFNSRNA